VIEPELSPSRGLNRAARAGTGRAGNFLRSLHPIEDLLGCHLGRSIIHQALNERGNGLEDTRYLLVVFQPFHQLRIGFLALGRGFEHGPGRTRFVKTTGTRLVCTKVR